MISQLFSRKLRMNGLLLVFLLLILLPGTYAQKVRFAGKDNNWLGMHMNYVAGTSIPARCLMPTWIPTSRLTACSIKRLCWTGKAVMGILYSFW